MSSDPEQPDEPVAEEPATPQPSSPAEPLDAKGPLAWMANNHVAANVLMLILLIGGVLLAGRIKQEVFPAVELDMVVVQVPYPGASPAEVEQGVLLAIEEAVRGIDGVKEVSATANEGVGVVAVELLLGTNSDRALSDVKSAVDRITSFPQDIERPVISLANTRRQVMSLVVHGNHSESELRAEGERVRQGLLDDPGITYVELSAVRPLEIDVEVPQENLRHYGLTLEQVAARIRTASVEVPGGTVRTQAGDVLLRTTERRDRGAEFGDIVLRAAPDGSVLHVRDVGQVIDGFAETDQEAYFDGERAVLVNVYRVGDETPVGVSAAVQTYLHDHAAEMPAGISATIWHDRSEMYRDRVDLLRRNAILGLVLVLLSLGLFLEPKLAFWVTLGIPISFAGSLLFLPMADVSINMISLFAFIVTLGMVVDDAIVVGEAVHHHRAQGDSPIHSAIAGVREVSIPVVFSVLTTCVAFMPLLFVPGVMGKFFRVIPIVVISVLLISLVESLIVLPAHLSRPMPRWLEILLWPILFPLGLLHGKRVERAIHWFIFTFYRKTLELALRWRYATIALALATFIGTVGVIAGGRLKFTFMPKIESDVVSASLRMPVGTPLAETREVEERLQHEAQAVLTELSHGRNATRGVFVELGSASSLGGGPRGGGSSIGGHLANVVVYLVPMDQRDFSSREFARRWRARIGEVAGAETLTFDYSTGASSGAPIDLRLTHADPQILEAAATRLASELHSYAGVSDIDSGVSVGKEQLDLELQPEALARGLTETDVARQLRAAFYGAAAGRQQRGRDELRIFVRYPPEERRSLSQVERFIVRTPTGGEMPLGDAARIQRGRAYTSIKRVDGKRVISVTADIVEGQANANQVVASLRQRELPALMRDIPGLTWDMGGEQKAQAEMLASLSLGFRIALVVMFGMLAIVFRSYVQPLLVMLAIPFGFVGAIWGHLLMGYGLSLISMMGVVAMAGVVVNDSLVLVDAVNTFHQSGMSFHDAVVAGGTRRFRPILLTSVTTFFGLTPMILEPSLQARFLIPMALSLGFGVIFATAVTLIIVPSAYLTLEDIRHLPDRLREMFASRNAGAREDPSPAE